MNSSISEYTLERISHTLLDRPSSYRLSIGDLGVFYMPFLDKWDMPIDGKYGGDSFLFRQIGREEYFFMIKNGVSHGGTGRNAIQRDDEILRSVIKDNSLEFPASNMDLSLIAHLWNEAIIKLEPEVSPFLLSSTLIMGIVSDSHIQYVNCGDSSIVIIDETGTIINKDGVFKGHAFGLGMISYQRFPYPQDNIPEQGYDLHPGSRVVFFTDGLNEGVMRKPPEFAAEKSDFFGLERVVRLLAQTKGLSPTDIILKINKEVATFLEGKEGLGIYDDYTLLALQI
ncbi:MAG: SpoIIE family protein phosphatase [archaeon]